MCFDRFHIFTICFISGCWVSPKDYQVFKNSLISVSPSILYPEIIFSVACMQFPQSQQSRNLLSSKPYQLCLLHNIAFSKKKPQTPKNKQNKVFWSFFGACGIGFFNAWIDSLGWYQNCCLLHCTEVLVLCAIQIQVLQKDGEFISGK